MCSGPASLKYGSGRVGCNVHRQRNSGGRYFEFADFWLRKLRYFKTGRNRRTIHTSLKEFVNSLWNCSLPKKCHLEGVNKKIKKSVFCFSHPWLEEFYSRFCLHFRNIRSNLFLSHISFRIGHCHRGRGASIDPFTHWWHGRICPRQIFAKPLLLNAIIIKPTPIERWMAWRCEKIPFRLWITITSFCWKKSLSQPVTPHMRVTFFGEVVWHAARSRLWLGRYPGGMEMKSAKFTGELISVANCERRDSVVIVNRASHGLKNKWRSILIGKKYGTMASTLKIIGVTVESKNTTPQIYFPVSLLTAKTTLPKHSEVFLDAEKQKTSQNWKKRLQHGLLKRTPTQRMILRC